MHAGSRNSLRRHNRLIAALCDDLASREFRDRGVTPRADAAHLQSRLRIEEELETAHGRSVLGQP